MDCSANFSIYNYISTERDGFDPSWSSIERIGDFTEFQGTPSRSPRSDPRSVRIAFTLNGQLQGGRSRSSLFHEAIRVKIVRCWYHKFSPILLALFVFPSFSRYFLSPIVPGANIMLPCLPVRAIYVVLVHLPPFLLIAPFSKNSISKTDDKTDRKQRGQCVGLWKEGEWFRFSIFYASQWGPDRSCLHRAPAGLQMLRWSLLHTIWHDFWCAFVREQ